MAGTEDGADGPAFPGEAGRVFLEAEAAALGLLEEAEKQQATAKDLQLGVQTAIRDLALEKFELGKVATAIAESHKGYKEAIGGAVAEFQGKIAGADATVSAYVLAALERHQGVIAKALKDAADEAVGQVEQKTEGAANQTLGSLRKAAQAAEGYVESAKEGVKAFRDRQWLMLGGAFMGGVMATLLGAVTILVLLGDGERRAKVDQLEGQILERQNRLDQIQKEIETIRPGSASAPGVQRKKG